MKLSDLDYHLPPERIAQRPLPQRDASRLLLLDRGTGAFHDHRFRELPELLRGDELMVVNNVRVLAARLLGYRLGLRAMPPSINNRARDQFLQSSIEALLVRQIEPWVWEALVKPGRKVPVGEKINFEGGALEAEVIGRGDYGLRHLRFSPVADFARALQACGHIPLPPYIQRSDDAADRERYQTVFAREPGAVAAPTAGLHFTSEILAALRQRGVELAEITLEVGLGTFEPVRTEILEAHQIHAESYTIPESTARAIHAARSSGRPVLAVGTTVVRALEDAAEKAAARLGAAQRDEPMLAAGKAEADIFLYPGKPFRVVDQMLTNFHLPKSSLLALVAAFAGRENVLRAYAHAVAGGYRFYSYGDCMLIRAGR